MVRKSDGSLIHSQKRQLDSWAEHFREQLSLSNFIVCPSPIPAKETLHVDIGPLTEAEHWVAKPGGISLSFFKHHDEVLASELTELLGSI